MKKFIFILLLTLFFIPNVKADCINLYEATPGNLYKQVSGSWTYLYSSTDANSYYQIQLESGKKYTFFATLNNEITDKPILQTTTSISIYGNSFIPASLSQSYTFTAKSSKFQFNYNNPTEDDINIYQTWQYWLVEGSETCLPTIEEPEPEIPEEPEEPTVIPDSTLDNFYSIYISKLSLISGYALENKFILGTITIIILFIVLEIILKFFIKGGYR